MKKDYKRELEKKALKKEQQLRDTKRKIKAGYFFKVD